jgi:hypothetical protein
MVRNPAILRLMQSAGLDFARFDMEHASPSMENILDKWKEARGHGTETVPPITLAPAAEKRVSSIEGCALRRRRDALTSGAWLCWWFTSSWEELPSITVIRAYVRPCALRRDK